MSRNIKVQIVTRKGVRFEVVSEMETDLLSEGNSVEHDLAENAKVVEFLRAAADRYEAEGTEGNIKLVQELMRGFRE